MIRRMLSLSGLLFAATVLSGCGGVDSDESQPIVTDPTQGEFFAVYKPATAQAPFPNDIYFSGTTDGTLNIPASPANPALSALNELDGYSLNASIYADVTDSIADASLINGATVFLFDLTNPLAPVPVAATVQTADFANGQSTVEIIPSAPLKPATTYAAFLTNNIQSTTGEALGADETFASLQALYAGGLAPGDAGVPEEVASLYGAIHPLLQLADGATIGAQNLAVAWSFKTQSIGASLASIEATATAQTSRFVPVLRDPANPGAGIATPADLTGNPAAGNNADVYVGFIELPYYTTDPLTGNWVPADAACQAVVDAVEALTTQPASTTSACPTPALQNTFQVPVILTVPNGGPTGGVTIFQHGITSNRSTMLAIAGALAQAGQATIAIDLPLHGITDTTSGLYSENLEASMQAAFAGTPFEGSVEDIVEQTFDLDTDSDGEIDSSGANFINLSSLLTTRDSLRQAAANLIYLTKSIPTMDYNAAVDGGATPNDFNGLPVNFVGMSLGAITGTSFLATNTDITAAILNVPGGNLTQLLTNSNTFAPVINAGLAENGVIEGTRFYEEFIRNAQTVVDGGDAINYGAAANANHSILMHEVIGGAGSPPDQVIPNSATDALAAVMGLSQVSATTGTSDGIVKFTAGSHSSLLDPTANGQVTQEMQTEASLFIVSGGTAITVTDSTYVD